MGSLYGRSMRSARTHSSDGLATLGEAGARDPVLYRLRCTLAASQSLLAFVRLGIVICSLPFIRLLPSFLGGRFVRPFGLVVLGRLVARGRAGSTSRTRPPGLTMTPSRTNLVLAGDSSASKVTPTSSATVTRPASATRLPQNTAAAHVTNAASTNPALLHLKSDQPGLATKDCSFSWDRITGVTTYPALDVDSFRAERRKLDAAREEMPPPPVPSARVKDRKKLFYFGDIE
ncbi:hypothetical protein JCM10296v2_005764 [Rhodotorula toruloides]